MDPVQIPPIRTPLQFDPTANNGTAAQDQQTEQTTKEWYLFWDKLNNLVADNAERIDEISAGGGAGGEDAQGPVTGFSTAHEVGTRYADDKDRLVHMTVGFTPIVPTPQPVTYFVSSDNGSTWVWIGSQRMQHDGQELKVDRLAPGEDSQWKVATVAGNLGGDPSPLQDADLDALYPGVKRSASFPVKGYQTPVSSTGITATIGSCTDQIRADGSHYGLIPGVIYTDPIGTTDFFVRITVQNLDSAKNPLTAEQAHGGTQITGGTHTENDLAVTYIPSLAFMRYRFYLANRGSQGSGDFIDPETNTLQQVLFNGSITTADHYDVPITIPPDPGPGGVDFNVVSVTASEVGPKYQDEKQGLHTVIGVIPKIDHDYSSPRTVTIWFDFGDGTPVWQGWYALTFSDQVVRIGDSTLGTDGVRKAGDIWVPANVNMGTWQVWCGPGHIDKGINPNAYPKSSFPVKPVGACSPTGTTNAQFVNNPATSDPIIYSKYDPGIWYWEYYELTWQPPTLAQEPDYWFSLLTVQKGHWDGSTWTPAPDAEGRNDDPTGQYIGRVMDEVVLAPGIDPAAITVMKKFGANPATWKIPPAQNADLTPNLYRDFRFLIYSVSRLGTDNSGSGGAGTYTLQTACWPGGKSFFILTPQPQASVLDIRAANPNTITLPLTGGNGQPLTVEPGAITGPYLGDASVTDKKMAQDAITAANGALAANAVVDSNINDVGIAKVTYGTSVFWDVVISRGASKPVVTIQNTGITLFGQANASDGLSGLLSKPYVQIQSGGIKLVSGAVTSPSADNTGGSIQIDAATGSMNFWSRDGDTTFPYTSVSRSGLAMVNGPNSFAVNTNAMSFLDTQNKNRIDINSAGIAITHGLKADNTPAANANQVLITSTAVQLVLGGVPQITMDSSKGTIVVSNGGSASVTVSATAVTIVNGSMTAPVINGGSITGTSLSISTSQGTVSISNSTSGVEVVNGANVSHIASNLITVYNATTAAELAPTSLVVGKSTASFCGFNANPGTGNEGLVVGGRQVCKLDSNNWLGGLQFATAQVFPAVFGIYNVSFGWPQTAASGSPTPPGGYGPGAANGTVSTFQTGDGRTVYVCGGLILNVK